MGGATRAAEEQAVPSQSRPSRGTMAQASQSRNWVRLRLGAAVGWAHPAHPVRGCGASRRSRRIQRTEWAVCARVQTLVGMGMPTLVGYLVAGCGAGGRRARGHARRAGPGPAPSHESRDGRAEHQLRDYDKGRRAGRLAPAITAQQLIRVPSGGSWIYL